MRCWPAERPARVFTLHNGGGMRVAVSERGAALVSWWAPDRYGRMADVLLGPDGAQHAARWHGEWIAGRVGVRLRLSAGADPAAVVAEARYDLDDDGGLSIAYQAVAAAPTLVSLVPDARFNLNGGHADVRDHMLQIAADRYFETDADGRLRDTAVSGTPFDFRRPAAIGPRLRWPHAQAGLAAGFDHCYRVGAGAGTCLARQVAAIHDPRSGRLLQVSTTETGLRFCSGEQPAFRLDAGAFQAHGDGSPAARVLLRPGEVYRQTTVYRLGVQL